MSVEIIARVICDGCGTAVVGKTVTRSTEQCMAWGSAKDAAHKAGWMTLDHGRFYPNRHFCPACQDKPLPKLPALKRRPKPDNSKCRLVGFKRTCPTCGTTYEPITMGSKCPTCFPVTPS